MFRENASTVESAYAAKTLQDRSANLRESPSLAYVRGRDVTELTLLALLERCAAFGKNYGHRRASCGSPRPVTKLGIPFDISHRTFRDDSRYGRMARCRSLGAVSVEPSAARCIPSARLPLVSIPPMYSMGA